jgi:hypothetical protein
MLKKAFQGHAYDQLKGSPMYTQGQTIAYTTFLQEVVFGLTD